MIFPLPSSPTSHKTRRLEAGRVSLSWPDGFLGAQLAGNLVSLKSGPVKEKRAPGLDCEISLGLLELKLKTWELGFLSKLVHISLLLHVHAHQLQFRSMPTPDKDTPAPVCLLGDGFAVSLFPVCSV